jgi:hypothetical protein
MRREFTNAYLICDKASLKGHKTQLFTLIASVYFSGGTKAWDATAKTVQVLTINNAISPP